MSTLAPPDPASRSVFDAPSPAYWPVRDATAAARQPGRRSATAAERTPHTGPHGGRQPMRALRTHRERIGSPPAFFDQVLDGDTFQGCRLLPDLIHAVKDLADIGVGQHRPDYSCELASLGDA